MGTRIEACLICLKTNYEDKNLMLFDLSTTEWENVTYLRKLENFLNAEIVIYDSTAICNNCINNLNNACDFKERVVRALDYWTVRFEETFSADNKQTELPEKSELPESTVSDVSGGVVEPLDIVGDENKKIIELQNIEDLPNDDKDDYFKCSTFPCDKCSYMFLTESELILHSCDTLSDTNKNKEEEPKLKKHSKKQKSDLYTCDLCDSSFSKKWILNKHFKRHAVDKKHVCTFCNRAFKQSYHLREHITTHTGERNFPCNVCGKKFQRISSQRRHARTHTAPPGQKTKKSPFLCNICGKSFPYSNGAQRHMRIHTGDRRYECKICGRKFSQSTHLRVHLARVHLGTSEKQHRCSICGQAFSMKASLNKHVKGHKKSKKEVKIVQNLEPNLSRIELKEDDDKLKDEFIIEDLPVYDHQGFLIVCNQ